jgi:hypothetical protein
MKIQEHSAGEELAQAEQKVEEVLDRIKDGDPKATPKVLEDAERRVRFARARVEGEESRQAEEAERERLQRIEELRERAIKDLDLEAVQKARQKARQKAAKALDGYIVAIAESNARIAEIATELDGLAPLPDDVSTGSGSYGSTLSVAGRDYRPQREVVLVADLAREQLRGHVRGIIDLEEPV